jgi:hypothetical protein
MYALDASHLEGLELETREQQLEYFIGYESCIPHPGLGHPRARNPECLRCDRGLAHTQRARERYDGVAHREPDLEVRGDTLLPLPEEEIVVLSDAAFEDSFVEPEVLRIHSGWIWQAELSQSLPRELTEVVNSDHKMP